MSGSAAKRVAPFRARYLLAAGLLVGGAGIAQPVAAPGPMPAVDHMRTGADLSVMTYNVRGLPWPLAQGREAALRRIGTRLARMRAEGRQPDVVVLQEAFTPAAKAIGDLAGYPYQVHGPYLRGEPGERADAGGRWYRGETQSALLDSGLVILSDLPVTAIDRAAFPTGACAGYDCLAAKGVVMATLALPGGGMVTIANTHLNSRAAAGAPYERTHAAYRRQAAFLAGFLARHRAAGAPVILAGDFNRGRRPARIAALRTSFGEPREGLLAAPGLARSADAAWIRKRARDMQLLFDGTRRVEPVGAEIPFGTESDGSTLSDHMGFTVDYRLVPLRKQA